MSNIFEGTPAVRLMHYRELAESARRNAANTAGVEQQSYLNLATAWEHAAADLQARLVKFGR